MLGGSVRRLASPGRLEAWPSPARDCPTLCLGAAWSESCRGLRRRRPLNNSWRDVSPTLRKYTWGSSPSSEVPCDTPEQLLDAFVLGSLLGECRTESPDVETHTHTGWKRREEPWRAQSPSSRRSVGEAGSGSREPMRPPRDLGNWPPHQHLEGGPDVL